jgi:hypothetical protein
MRSMYKQCSIQSAVRVFDCRAISVNLAELKHRFLASSGVSMTSEKIAAIADWPDPATPKEMRSFVGLAGV